jgi:O-antigen ligase
MPANPRFQYYFAAGLCFFFAIALQIQISFFQTENYEGLRLSLADLGLPFAGVFIFASVLLKKSSWPSFQKPFGYGWLVALTFVFLAALLNGYFSFGEWNHWALINKFFGWFILMAYLGTGAWINTNFGATKEKFFIKPFLGFFMASILMLPILILIYLATGLPELLRFAYRPYAGLMANPNAYAFLLCTVSVIITMRFFKDRTLFPVSILLWALIPFVLFFSGSRILWLCLIFLILLFFVKDWRKTAIFLIPAFLVGGLCAFFPYKHTNTYLTLRPVKSMEYLYNYTIDPQDSVNQGRIARIGDGNRLMILKLSYETWKEKPLLGAGLGALQIQQIEEHKKLLAAVDNTLLWIAAEMGLAGVFIFIGTYIAMVYALWRKHEDFAFYALIMLLIFGLFSLFHEVLYTRFMWFIMGLALARKQ